jgi:hypothetical protein
MRFPHQPEGAAHIQRRILGLAACLAHSSLEPNKAISHASHDNRSPLNLPEENRGDAQAG